MDNENTATRLFGNPAIENKRLKWDNRFLTLAGHISQWSKDPSTKVGAVIVDAGRRVRGTGYNGFPRGVKDLEGRYFPDKLGSKQAKYSRVVHAELNAVLEAKNCEGMTIYITMFSCNECAKAIIQSGITRVVAPPPGDSSWSKSQVIAEEMYREAGVTVDFITQGEPG